MKIFLRIIAYAKPYWKHLLISMVCTIFFSLFSGASIYLLIPLLQTLFNQSAFGGVAPAPTMEHNVGGVIQGIESFKQEISQSFYRFIFSENKVDSLLKICLILLIAFLLKNLFGYFQAYALGFVEQGVIKDLRNDLYRHIHQLSLGYFTNERTGGLISRVTNDVNFIQQSISASFLNLLREPLLIIVFLGIAISISWQLTLIALLLFPFLLYFISRIGLRLHKVSGVTQEKMADITSVLQETISGVKVVKAFGMEEFENRKFADATKKYFQQVLKIHRMRNLSSPVTEFLSALAAVVIIWFGGREVLETQNLQPAEFLGFLFAIFQLMPPVKELSSVHNRIQESSAAGKRIFEILDTEPAIQNASNSIVLREFKDSIKFENVSFFYEQFPNSVERNGRAVLKHVNLRLRKGEIIAIVGPSGGGKTTLIDLIPRFYDPIDGRILIDGIDLRQIELKSLRDKIGIVTQETILFNDTVRNNIAYGLDDCPMEEIVEAAKAANAHDFIMEMPNGYDMTIGERGTKLSGGQRQRLSIARAILKNPPIMIFDEATSSLDSESEILVQEAIEHLMKHRTSFVIAHRLSTIRNADRIIVIDKGKIVQTGQHHELIKQKRGLYKKLYDMQFNM